jgi:hypothetical protein
MGLPIQLARRNDPSRFPPFFSVKPGRSTKHRISGRLIGRPSGGHSAVIIPAPDRCMDYSYSADDSFVTMKYLNVNQK